MLNTGVVVVAALLAGDEDLLASALQDNLVHRALQNRAEKVARFVGAVDLRGDVGRCFILA